MPRCAKLGSRLQVAVKLSFGIVRREIHRRIVVNQPQPYTIKPPNSPENILVDRRIGEEVHG